MYVIEATTTRDTAGTLQQDGFGNVLGADAGSTVSFIMPAESCTWTTTPDTSGRGYAVDNVRFWPAQQAGIPVVPGAAFTTSSTEFRFGYIGKSGRFVEIAS